MGRFWPVLFDWSSAIVLVVGRQDGTEGRFNRFVLRSTTGYCSGNAHAELYHLAIGEPWEGGGDSRVPLFAGRALAQESSTGIINGLAFRIA